MRLSFEQELLWDTMHEQRIPELANVQLALRLEGKLDERALQRSLAELVRRHDALRMVFLPTDGRPVQSVREAPHFDLLVSNLKQRGALREGPPSELRMALHLQALVELKRPFDLANDLPLRATLIRTSGRDHRLVMTLHQLSVDD